MTSHDETIPGGRYADGRGGFIDAHGNPLTHAPDMDARDVEPEPQPVPAPTNPKVPPLTKVR